MRKHIRTVSNLWKCSDHAHTRAKNRAVAEFQRLSLSLLLTNMRFLEDRMFALKTGQGRDKKNLMMVLQMKLFLGFAVFFVACFTSLRASAQKLTPVFSLWAASCCDGCGIKCSC